MIRLTKEQCFQQLAQTIAIVAEAFKAVCDKAGKPYILHCLHVMHQMPQDDPELMMIAVMHDLIEDTDYTFADLVELGYSARVVEALRLLTHESGVPYMDYIERISTSKDATEVKKADLRHNSDIMRMKGLREKDMQRLEKYHRAYAYLTGLSC